MNTKTYALITDIHSNSVALKKGLEIINSRDDIDKIVFLGDYFSLGPEPKEILDCGNSGTTMRLLIGLLAGKEGKNFITTAS